MDENILGSIKKLLTGGDDETYFDPDLIIHINSVLSILNQLGVGTDFRLTTENYSDATWSDFMDPVANLQDVITYVFIRVKMIFDPPESGTVMNAYTAMKDELEWRINIQAEENTD